MSDCPVLIVGAGPVGLALAIELGLRDIACTVVEKYLSPPNVPKMSGLTVRGMELNRRWGIARDVEKVGWPAALPADFVYCANLFGHELMRVAVPPYSGRRNPLSPEKACGCSLSYYDPILAARAATLRSVTIRRGVELTALSQDGERVTATLVDRSSGQTETLAASYVAGCDGAKSVVAAHTSARYEGSGTLTLSTNVYFRSPDLAAFAKRGRFFRFVDGGGSWGEMIGIDGAELWRLSTYSTAAETTPESVDAPALLRRLAGREIAHEVLSVTVWERREAVLDKYRDGRVFIVGDAAHQHSPTGGFGLHTGLLDAFDLGWKLAAVLEGWGGPRLLDSYETERKPLALRSVRAATDEFEILTSLPGGAHLDEASPRGEAERLAFTRAFVNRSPPAHRNESLRLGYAYDDSPVIAYDTSAPTSPHAEPEPLGFTPSSRPGMRAPHAWLDGERSTLDLFGDGFVLLRFGDAPDTSPMLEAARARGIPLRTVDIANAEIAALYERRLVLVRPDGHVAFRADALPSDLGSVLDRIRGVA